MSVTSSCRDINQLNKVAKTACELFVKRCKEAGLNVLITETVRTQERQNYLYCQGRTVNECVAKGISREFATKYCNPKAQQVTWTLSSNHKTGYAWDACKNKKGEEYSDKAFFKKMGAIAKELGIEWGGVWSTPDTPHFQVTSSWKSPVTEKPKEEYKVVKTKIELNGKVKDVDTINVNGFNYIKLRDLEDSKIKVSYDDAKKLPIIGVEKNCCCSCSK